MLLQRIVPVPNFDKKTRQQDNKRKEQSRAERKREITRVAVKNSNTNCTHKTV
jgi:hypothetical protein